MVLRPIWYATCLAFQFHRRGCAAIGPFRLRHDRWRHDSLLTRGGPRAQEKVSCIKFELIPVWGFGRPGCGRCSLCRLRPTLRRFRCRGRRGISTMCFGLFDSWSVGSRAHHSALPLHAGEPNSASISADAYVTYSLRAVPADKKSSREYFSGTCSFRRRDGYG